MKKLYLLGLLLVIITSCSLVEGIFEAFVPSTVGTNSQGFFVEDLYYTNYSTNYYGNVTRSVSILKKNGIVSNMNYNYANNTFTLASGSMIGYYNYSSYILTTTFTNCYDGTDWNSYYQLIKNQLYVTKTNTYPYYKKNNDQRYYNFTYTKWTNYYSTYNYTFIYETYNNEYNKLDINNKKVETFLSITNISYTIANNSSITNKLMALIYGAGNILKILKNNTEVNSVANGDVITLIYEVTGYSTNINLGTYVSYTNYYTNSITNTNIIKYNSDYYIKLK